MSALALQRKDEIIQRVANGEFLRVISADLGITPAAISQNLAKDLDYQAARETGIEQQLENWQQEIATADDGLKLGRARESFRAVAWRAEREHAARWGAKQEIKHTGTAPMLSVTVVAAPQSAVEHRVIESE